jgi:hypothetical protein
MWSSRQSSWLQNGDVWCFLWGTNWIYICYVEESRPPLWSSGQSSWLQNGDVLCFMWGTSWIYICYVEESRPHLRSSGQSSWLPIQMSRVLFPALPDFLRSSGSGTGPLSLVSTTEELLGRTSSGSGLENREYGPGDPLRWHPISSKVGSNLVDKRRSLVRYSLFAEWGHGVGLKASVAKHYAIRALKQQHTF